jgi:hypothetical protein
MALFGSGIHVAVAVSRRTGTISTGICAYSPDRLFNRRSSDTARLGTFLWHDRDCDRGRGMYQIISLVADLRFFCFCHLWLLGYNLGKELFQDTMIVVGYTTILARFPTLDWTIVMIQGFP